VRFRLVLVILVRWAVEIRNSLWIRPVTYTLVVQSNLIFGVTVPFLMHRNSRLPQR